MMILKQLLGLGLMLVGIYNAAWGGTGYIVAMGVIVAYLLLLGAVYHRKSRQKPLEFDRFTALLTGLSVVGFVLIAPFSLILILLLAPEHARFPLLGLYALFMGGCWLWWTLNKRYGWTDTVLKGPPKNEQAAE